MSASRSVANYGNKVQTISSGVVHEQIIVLIQLKGSDLRQYREQQDPDCIFDFVVLHF